MLDWGVLFIVVVVLVVAAALWWFVPKLQAARLQSKSPLSEKQLIRLEDEFRKTAAQAAAGLILLLTAAVAFQQLREAARATDMNDRQQRLAKGVELLGKWTASEQMAGIHILGDWAERASRTDTSSDEARYSIVVPALTSFVREQTKFPVGDEACETFARPESKTVASEVQAALDVLTKRSKQGPLSLNMRGLNLSRANLSGARLVGSTLAFADLSDANLSDADLSNTDLYCANLYRANLSGANLSGSTIDREGSSTNLAGAYLVHARFCKSHGRPSNLTKTNLVSVNLDEAYLDETDLSGARLRSASLYRTTFMRVRVDPQTDFASAVFNETTVIETALTVAKNVGQPIQLESVPHDDSALCEDEPVSAAAIAAR